MGQVPVRLRNTFCRGLSSSGNGERFPVLVKMHRLVHHQHTMRLEPRELLLPFIGPEGNGNDKHARADDSKAGRSIQGERQYSGEISLTNSLDSREPGAMRVPTDRLVPVYVELLKS